MRGVMAVWAVAMAVAATTHAMVPGGGDDDKLVLGGAGRRVGKTVI